MAADICISLKAAKVNANMSQKEAARSLNISISTLRNYEKGATVPDWNIVQSISNLYRLPTDVIFLAVTTLKAIDKH